MLRILQRIALLTLCLAGCSSKDAQSLPEVHPVKGKLTSDGQPVKEGFVRFMLENNPDYIVSGDVTANGDFELQTSFKDKRLKGAPTGTYTVLYTPPGNDQRHPSITLKTMVTVDANTSEVALELAAAK